MRMVVCERMKVCVGVCVCVCSCVCVCVFCDCELVPLISVFSSPVSVRQSVSVSVGEGYDMGHSRYSVSFHIFCQ